MDAKTDPEAGPEPANEDAMAIDNPPGAARPKYNQYRLNDPQALDKDKSGEGGTDVERAADDV